jgi:hypothetical protein
VIGLGKPYGNKIGCGLGDKDGGGSFCDLHFEMDLYINEILYCTTHLNLIFVLLYIMVIIQTEKFNYYIQIKNLITMIN